jgi:two-component system cell cycle response regulator DivK
MKTVAVVEDNEDNRVLVCAILDGRYRVVEYTTGADALAGMRRERPDLVLLDNSLPGMDGPEVLRRLRDEPELRDLPVVVLTAHAMKGDRERFLALGFDDYIAKPIVDERDLLGAVARLLRGRA